MTSYGEQAAKQIMASQEFMVSVALAGNVEALRALIEVAAATSYAAGYGAASAVVGVTL